MLYIHRLVLPMSGLSYQGRAGCLQARLDLGQKACCSQLSCLLCPPVRQRQSSGRHFIGKPPSDRHYHVLEYILSSHYRLCWNLMGRSLTSQAWHRAEAAGPQRLWSLVFLTSLFTGFQTPGPVWLNQNIRHLGNSVRRTFLRPVHPSPVTSLPWYLKNLASSSQTLLHVKDFAICCTCWCWDVSTEFI